MRTPAWARRTLAGARSPVRASSLPAMLSWVTSTARPPSSSARATPIGPPIGSNTTMSPAAGSVAAPRRTSATSRTTAPSATSYSRTAGDRAGALHDDVDPSGTSSVPVRTSTPSRPTSAAEPVDERPLGPATAASPPSSAVRSTSTTRWPALGGDAGHLQPGRSATDDGDVARRARRDVPVGVLGLPSRRRLADARHERVAGVAHLARLVAAGARADPLGLPGAQLGDEVGIGDLGPGHLDGRARRRVVVAADGPLGLADVDDRALQDDGHVDGGGDGRGQADVEPGRLVEVGTGLLDREDRAPHDDDVVDAGADEVGGDRRRHLRRDAGPRGDLVARQAQPDDVVGADGGPHGGEHGAGEVQAVGAPLVAALVRQPGQELAHEAVLAGVDLDAVAPGLDGSRGGGDEAVDDGGDVLGLHPLRDLARRHLRHPRRRPQRRLAVGRRALPAGVVERGDDERAVRPAGGDDGGPPGGGPGGQRRPLVRPVGLVDARPLDDDRAAPAAGPPLVVGGVAAR